MSGLGVGYNRLIEGKPQTNQTSLKLLKQREGNMPAEIFLGSWCDESESPVANLLSDNNSTVKKYPDAGRKSPSFPTESSNGDFVITLSSTYFKYFS